MGKGRQSYTATNYLPNIRALGELKDYYSLSRRTRDGMDRFRAMLSRQMDDASKEKSWNDSALMLYRQAKAGKELIGTNRARDLVNDARVLEIEKFIDTFDGFRDPREYVNLKTYSKTMALKVIKEMLGLRIGFNDQPLRSVREAFSSPEAQIKRARVNELFKSLRKSGYSIDEIAAAVAYSERIYPLGPEAVAYKKSYRPWVNVQ